MKQQVILIILDGWGIGAKDNSNPIYMAKTPYLDYIKTHFPSGALQASGIAVGLPWGEEGNSEVGHLTIGAGKVLYQHYPKITMSIKDGSFFKNPVLLKAAEHAKKNNSAINFAGLLTDANIHASIEHMLALIEFAKRNGLEKINLHLFTDGKDSPPRSALGFLKKIPIPVATISGRYYSEDRTGHWERTQKTYEVMVGNDQTIPSAEDFINSQYLKGLNDQYIEPRVIGPENRGIKDGDALVFFDYREDSIRQIAESFINKDFSAFQTKKFENLFIATMTQYSDNLKVPVIFPQEKIEKPLGKVLAENGKTQLRVAETEKYAHITYFLNGLIEPPMENEYRVLIPSQRIAHQEDKPEMMASEITTRVIQAIEEGAFDFILANYANGDLIAHTGNFDAGMEAVKIIDEEIGKIAKTALSRNAALIITSDHGNIEKMIDSQTARALTGHDSSPVPIYLIANQYRKETNTKEAELAEKETVGILSDVAPTILELMNVAKPKEMTGQSLIKFLIE